MLSASSTSVARRGGLSVLLLSLIVSLGACGESPQADASAASSAAQARDDSASPPASGSTTTAAVESAATRADADKSLEGTAAPAVAGAAGEDQPIVNRVFKAVNTDDAARERSLDRLARFIAKLGELGKLVDRSHIDTDVLLESLDYDYDRIVAFVSDDIGFEQYPGSLRGARGTLVSGAGNALDQSLLLAKLLRDAGYDARIARGQLDAADATRLVDGIAVSKGDRELARSPADWQKSLTELQAIAGAAEPVRFDPIRQQPFYATATRTRDELLSELRSAGVTLPVGEPSGLRAEAADYYWVEARKGASGGWSNLHPAFAGQAVDTPTASKRFDGELPADVQQRLRIEVFIAQKLGDSLKTVRVAGPWERPTANLDGELLRFSNQPNTLDRKAINDGVGQAVKRAQLFVPVLNGKPGLAFDLNGTTIDTAALGMDTFGAAGIFKTVGDKTERATSALSALGSNKPAEPAEDLRALAAQWIEYTLISPDGSEKHFRRPVMSRLGTDPWRARKGATLTALGEDEQRRELTVEQRIMLATGRYSESYVVDRAIQHLLGNAKAWGLMIDYLHGTPVNPRQRDDVAVSPLPHLALFRLFDRGPALFGADIAYRAEPTLVVLREGLVSDGVGFRSVDIVSNERRVLSKGSEGVKSAPDKALAIGVWETVSEALAHANLPGGDAHNNTFEIFAAAKKQGVAISVLKPDGQPDALAISDNEKRLVADDLARGFAVVVPEKSIGSRRFGGWWRVDPASGTTLGMTGDGRGQEMAEYLIDLTGNALTLINSLKNYADCEKYTDTATKACCLMEAHMRNIGGMALGGVIGSTFGGGVALMCDVGGMARAEIEGAMGTRNEWSCTVFDNPENMIGPGGIVNTTAMGCGAFQDQ